VSLVKQAKPTADDIVRASQHIEYHIYDLIFNEASSCMTFECRTNKITSLLKTLKGDNLRRVPTVQVMNQEQLDDLMGDYLEQGYEGQMVRASESPYHQKRTDQLLKRKEFVDGEWPIVGYKQGKGNREGCIILRCRNADGSEFDCSVKGSVQYTRDLWNYREKLVGLLATIKYQRLTPDGIPKFLTCIKFRNQDGEDLNLAQIIA
jgi:DNA ligase-1